MEGIDFFLPDSKFGCCLFIGRTGSSEEKGVSEVKSKEWECRVVSTEVSPCVPSNINVRGLMQ